MPRSLPLCLVTLLHCLGCKAAADPAAHQSTVPAPGRALARTAPASTREAPEQPPRRTAPAPRGASFVELAVEDQPSPIVWVPPPPSRGLPLLVVAHGAGGGPEWHCDFWSEVVQDAAFVLCLRGKPLGTGAGAHYFPEHHTLGRLFSSAIDTFDARYGERVDPELGVYIGYSQGATMGAWMLPAHARRFSSALFIEGGYGEWNVKRALEFRDNGGRAAYFACGTKVCNDKASRAVEWFERAGVAARMAFAEGQGHTPAGRVGVLAVEGLAWLLHDAAPAMGAPHLSLWSEIP